MKFEYTVKLDNPKARSEWYSGFKDLVVRDDPEKVIAYLKEAGFEPDAKLCTEGSTLLHWAALFGATKIIRLLLDKPEFDINPLWNGATPFNKACRYTTFVGGLRATEVVVMFLKDKRTDVSHGTTKPFLLLADCGALVAMKWWIALGREGQEIAKAPRYLGHHRETGPWPGSDDWAVVKEFLVSCHLRFCETRAQTRVELGLTLTDS